MYDLLLVLHGLLAVGLIGFVLIQHGKGADMGASFGSGASSTVFGGRGSASFLTRTTAVLAAGFFMTSLTLAYFTGEHITQKSVTEKLSTQTTTVTTPSSPSGGDLPAVPEPTSDLPVTVTTQENTVVETLTTPATTSQTTTVTTLSSSNGGNLLTVPESTSESDLPVAVTTQENTVVETLTMPATTSTQLLNDPAPATN